MIVQRNEIEIRHANHLPDSTLVVIGLWHMGYCDLKTVARLLWIIDLKPLRRLFKMLKTSKDPLIRRYVDVGLPVGVYRSFPFGDTKVRCTLCGRMVSCVPCPKCSMLAPREPEFRFRRRGNEPPCPGHRTTMTPGSLRKIAVFRARFERGEAIFHPRDARLR